MLLAMAGSSLPSSRVLAALALFGLGGVLSLWLGLPRSGELVAVVALPGGDAIVASRAANSDQYGFLTRVDGRAGEVLWRQRVGPMPKGDGGAWLRVGDGVVAVAGTGRDGLPEARTLDVRNGRARWQAAGLGDLAAPLRHDPRTPDVGLVVAGGALLHFHAESPASVRVVANEVQTGRALWRGGLEERPLVSAAPAGGLVMLRDRAGVLLLDVASGAGERVAAEGMCWAGERLWWAEGGELVSREVGGTAERVEADVRPAGVGPEVPVRLVSGLCASRRDRVVLLLTFGRAVERDERVIQSARSAVVALEGAEVVWRLDLGRAEASGVGGELMRRRYPEATPLGGEVPRFVPVQLEKAQPNGVLPSLVVMLDLEAGREVWRSAAREQLAGLRLMRRGVHTVLFEPEGGLLGLLDGETGRLVGAVALGTLDGGVLPGQLGEDGLWVFGEDAWALLDPETLVPVGSSGEVPWLADGAEPLKRRLGLPVGP